MDGCWSDSQTIAGELRLIPVVSDDATASKANGFCRFIESRPEPVESLPAESPAAERGKERAFDNLKYGHLCHGGIPDAPTLAATTEAHRQTFNGIPTAPSDRRATTTDLSLQARPGRRH
jgi:hypothetical protein